MSYNEIISVLLYVVSICYVNLGARMLEYSAYANLVWAYGILIQVLAVVMFLGEAKVNCESERESLTA
jgi:hypothetical protein